MDEEIKVTRCKLHHDKQGRPDRRLLAFVDFQIGPVEVCGATVRVFNGTLQVGLPGRASERNGKRYWNPSVRIDVDRQTRIQEVVLTRYHDELRKARELHGAGDHGGQPSAAADQVEDAAAGEQLEDAAAGEQLEDAAAGEQLEDPADQGNPIELEPDAHDQGGEVPAGHNPHSAAARNVKWTGPTS